MKKSVLYLTSGLIVAVALAWSIPNTVSAHGDVSPQAVDTKGLPALGKEWLEENPWRDPNSENWARAVEAGSSGYNSNCARCHGLGAVSGGLAPDLRPLEANIDGDEWYLERFKLGYTQNGITKMPAFGELLSQEAAWAIRTYLETRPDEGAIDDYVSDLKTIRDDLQAKVDAGTPAKDAESELAPMRSKMSEIADKIETASGAPKADSVAFRAASKLDGSPDSLKNAAEVLTVGLSAAK